MYQIATIPYLSTDGFLSILDTNTNIIYVSPRSLCEIFEIDWRGQQAKLSENSTRWEYQILLIKLPGDDQKRNVGVIPDKKVRSWICSINPDKVRQDIREDLIAFQDECDKVLNDYWTKGIAINPRHSSPIDESDKLFIAQIVSNSIKEAMHELSIALRESFVSKDTFHEFTNQYEHRLIALEQDREFQKPDIAQISVEQSQLLCNLVKEKGNSRKEVFQIWKKFRQKFQIESYQRLPNSKFQEALRWINQL